MKITNEQLSAYLDNALTNEERATVDRALAESPELRRELNRLGQLGPLLKGIPIPEPSEPFYRRVLAKTKPRPRTWLQWTLPLLGAAAAALMMVYVAEENKPSFRNFAKGHPAELSSAGQAESIGTKKMVRNLEKISPSREMGKAKLMVQENKPSLKGSTTPDSEARLSRRRMVSCPAPKTEAAAFIPPEERGPKRSDRSAIKPPQIERGVSPRAPESALDEVISPDLPPTQQWTGDSSGIEDHREIAIKDAAAWEKLWAEHQSNMEIPSPAPAVDFNNYMIVGIFLGEQGSSGYSVQLGESETVGNELIIPYKEAVPAPGLMGLTVITQPYCLKIIPRTNRPIRFKKV